MQGSTQKEIDAMQQQFEQYKNDKDYICVDAEGDEPAIVCKKFSDQDWDNLNNYIDQHPLFMKEFTIDDLENNEYVKALQTLKYDASAEENLEKLYVIFPSLLFQNEGNKYMKEKLIGKKDKPVYFIKKAMDAYCDALCQEAQCLDLRKRLLSNRALINLWLKNYGKVVEDCVNSINIDKNFISPYVRGTEALFKLEKYEKAVQLAHRGLEVEKDHKALSELLEEAQKFYQIETDKITKKHKEENQEKSELLELCKKKGVQLGKLSEFALPEIYTVRKKTDSQREMKVLNGAIVTPIIFMYPEFAQFDYTEEASEDVLLSEIFEEIISAGLPWDQDKFYSDKKDIRYFVVVKSRNV